jgi:TRAF3-interacting protein 1
MEDLIPEVKERIGALITKPKMSDKLLNKPPFRFLHDTISAIIVKTGFGDGLYTDEEMDSSTITEKALKVAYLEKIFTFVGICQGAPLDIRAAKVVAGLEPEHTSQFLIALARFASDDNFDSRAAVKQCLAGGQPGDAPAHQDRDRDRRAESKDDARDDRRDDDTPKSHTPPDDDDAKGGGPEPMEIPQATERGKSRGGQRSGRASQPSSSGLDDGEGGASQRPANLDSEIERCDGSSDVTKEMVGALITRPKLSDKLLGKPPFRFLHDINSEIIKQTGFATNLYTPEELASENVKDKDSKILYLEKIIQLVGTHLNTLTEVKAQKVVAGLEPINTNRFLQLLALCASSMPNSAHSVRAVHEAMGLAPAGGDSNRGRERDEPAHHHQQQEENKREVSPAREERAKPSRRESPQV